MKSTLLSPQLTLSLALAAAALGCGGESDPCDGLESGEACTWLGTPGVAGFNGDRDRRELQVNQVQDLLFLPDGTAWFSDFNNFLVRRVHPDGMVESMVGWTDPVFPGDGPIGGITSEGAPGEDWQLNHPTNLLLSPEGKVIIVAWHNHKILEVDPTDGYVHATSGGGAGFSGDGGDASGALFKQLNDATYDDAGNLYILDQQNQRIRRIDTAGIIDTFAGTGDIGDGGDGGPCSAAEFYWAVGSNPNPSGGIVHHEGKLYVSDTENHRVRVIDLETGIIDAFAGTGEPGYSGDGGPAVDAAIRAPRDLEVGPDGDLYFVETDNAVVRAVDLESGEIRTVVGTGELGLGEEGLLATETMLRRPFGLAFDPEGNLYVMDSLNNRIVKVFR